MDTAFDYQRFAIAPEATSGAIFSPCRKWRYLLFRRWYGPPTRWVNFLMFNPSIANESASDPTVTRRVNFARAWGYGGLIVTNLFALVSTDPRRLRLAADPSGPDNAAAILQAAKQAELTVCAWGSHGSFLGAGNKARLLLEKEGITLRVLRLNPKGQPTHPLYLPRNLTPVRWGFNS